MSAKLLQSCPTLCDLMDCSCQVLLSMEFSRKDYWSGLPFPPPGDLPNRRIEPASQVPPALAGEFFFNHQCHMGSPQIKHRGKNDDYI